MRDFLVQIREFTGEDDTDLYLEEREVRSNFNCSLFLKKSQSSCNFKANLFQTALKAAQEEKRKVQMSVPGILNPHEVAEEMQD